MDRTKPLLGLSIASFIHAVVYGLVAFFIPWSISSSFAVVCIVLALGYILLGVAAIGLRNILQIVWALQSWATLLFAVWLSLGVLSSAVYLSKLYGGLGVGVSVALLALLCPVYLLTLPMSLWGIIKTSSAHNRYLGIVSLFLLLVTTVVGINSYYLARPNQLTLGTDKSMTGILENLGSKHNFSLRYKPIRNPGPVTCSQDISQAEVTIFVYYNSINLPSSVGVCIQDKLSQIEKRLSKELVSQNAHYPIKLDVVVGYDHLEKTLSFLDGFQVNPALDGLCYKKSCLAPWQLVAHDILVSFTPLPFIPDLRLGVSSGQLAKVFNNRSLEYLGDATRIQTRSFVLDEKAVKSLSHLRSRQRELSKKNLEIAAETAIDYIVAAQLSNGRFIYKTHPFTGKKDTHGFSLPRHAGTTMALCESADHRADAKAVISKALAFMAGLAAKSKQGNVLKFRGARYVSVGQLSLPLVSFLSCEKHNQKYAKLMGGMTKVIMKMQRDNGSFHPYFDTSTFKPIAGADRLYGAGQAVLALVLAKRYMQNKTDNMSENWPKLDELSASIERAMSYFSMDYWKPFLRKFFFLEENWHCLAARAAIGVHEHSAYEQFCLDYAGFKARLILGHEPGIRPEFIGGHGFGNLVAPHNTPTAGLGEVFAAAAAVRKNRSEELDFEKKQLRSILSYLINEQWQKEDCWACVKPEHIVGGFSESMSSPIVRIDYVQHALSAISHGKEILGL